MKLQNNIFLHDNNDNSLLRQIQRNLENADSYQYASAYFDFNVISFYFDSLEKLIKNTNKPIRFIISSQVSSSSIKVIHTALNNNINDFINIPGTSELNKSQKLKLFKWIYEGKIKFKIVVNIKNGLFHYKLGFIEKNNSYITWSGSSNHTVNGLAGVNNEHLFFNRSETKNDIVNIFEDAWNNKIVNSLVLDPTNQILINLIDNNNWHKTSNLLLLNGINSLVLIDDEIVYCTKNKILYNNPPNIFNECKVGYKNKIENINWLALKEWIKNHDYISPGDARTMCKMGISKFKNWRDNDFWTIKIYE